jgi:hypothetical protein
MAQATLDGIYNQFTEMYADSKAIRWENELDAAIHAAGLDYENITREWLKSLDRAWVYRESDSPFRDLRHNRAYRRFLAG